MAARRGALLRQRRRAGGARRLPVRYQSDAGSSGESFATPETVPFWQLSSYIDTAEKAGLAAAGYRLQYYQLLAQPFYLVAMVLLAAAVSLRFFRFGACRRSSWAVSGPASCSSSRRRSRATEQGRTDGPAYRGGAAARHGRRDRGDRAPVPGGRVMVARTTHPRSSRRRTWCGALLFLAAAIALVAGPGSVSPSHGQLTFPPRPKPAVSQTAARSRCSFAPTRSTTTTPASASRPWATSSSISAARPS